MPSSSARPFERLLTDRHVASALMILAAAIYAVTLCPTIFTDDSGEITTAVTTWGVMHPTGYPLYCLIGGAVVHLLPWGEPAWRLGLLSVIPAAVVVGLLYTFLRRLDVSITWSVAGSLTVGFSYNLWSQATKVETYALNAAFITVLLLLAITFRQTGQPRWLVLCCLTAGFAATNHISSVWMLPAVAVPLISQIARYPHRPAMSVALGALCFLAPLNLYWYEMYAALHHPNAQVWGDPSTLQALVDHATGVKFHGKFGFLPQDRAISDFLRFGPSWIWTNIGLLLMLAPFGVLRLWRIDKPVTAMLVGGVCSDLVVVINYHIGNIYEYYTPVIILLSILGAVGGDFVSQWVTTRWRITPEVTRLLAVLIVIAAISPLGAGWSVCDRSRSRFVEQYARNILSGAPDHAVLVTTTDITAFSLWYVQRILGERPDVVVVYRGLLHSGGMSNRLNAWFFRKLDRQDPSLHMIDKLRRAASDEHYAFVERPLWDLVEECVRRNRPVCFVETVPTDVTDYQGNVILASVRPPCVLQQQGLLHFVVPVQRRTSPAQLITQNVNLITQLKIDPVSDNVRVLEFNSDSIWKTYSDAFAGVAADLLTERRWTDAARWAGIAVDEYPRSAEALDAFATAALNLGQKDIAIDSWRRAATLSPNDPSYAVKLNRVLAGQSP